MGNEYIWINSDVMVILLNGVLRFNSSRGFVVQ